MLLHIAHLRRWCEIGSTAVVEHFLDILLYAFVNAADAGVGVRRVNTRRSFPERQRQRDGERVRCPALPNVSEPARTRPNPAERRRVAFTLLYYAVRLEASIGREPLTARRGARSMMRSIDHLLPFRLSHANTRGGDARRARATHYSTCQRSRSQSNAQFQTKNRPSIDNWPHLRQQYFPSPSSAPHPRRQNLRAKI